jgi:hypothetical protein
MYTQILYSELAFFQAINLNIFGMEYENHRYLEISVSAVVFRRTFILLTEGKSPVGKPRHRRKYNIKMECKEIGCSGFN